MDGPVVEHFIRRKQRQLPLLRAGGMFNLELVSVASGVCAWPAKPAFEQITFAKAKGARVEPHLRGLASSDHQRAGVVVAVVDLPAHRQTGLGSRQGLAIAGAEP